MKRAIRVCVLIPAKNEAKNLSRVLESLNRQSLKPYKIVVLDDDSDDNTSMVALRHGAIVYRFRRKRKREYAPGSLHFLRVLDIGFRLCLKFNCEYIMRSDADVIFPNNYIERLINEMEKNDRLVIASGYIEGERIDPDAPRDTGRIFKTWFLKKNLPNSVYIGYEAYPVFSAIAQGFLVKTFPVKMYSLRPTSQTPQKCTVLGRGMKTVGYWFTWAILRGILTSLRKPKCGFYMIIGFLIERKKYQFATAISKIQRRTFLRKVLTYFRKGFSGCPH